MALFERWRHVFGWIVANSHAMKESLTRWGLGRVDMIHNGVAIHAPTAQPAREPVVAFAGRLVREKGVHVLLEAMASLNRQAPAASLLIAGDGPERDRLMAMSAKLGLGRSVTFLGYLSREEVERRFAAAWVQVVPSVWAEPFGRVAIEAMARGTAVVATEGGGLSEIVDDGRSGILIARGDAAALSAALARIVSDRATAISMGQAGHTRAVERFSLERQGELFVDGYRRLLAAA